MQTAYDSQAYYRQGQTPVASPHHSQQIRSSYFPDGTQYSPAPQAQQMYQQQQQQQIQQQSYRPTPPTGVIDLTGGTPPPMVHYQNGAHMSHGVSGAVQPPKDNDSRRDVVCIGQVNGTALVLYPIPYITSKGDPTHHVPDDFVPVRLRYDDAAKKRARTPGSEEETIQVTVPQYKNVSGEIGGGEEFGVVESRIAGILGPLMAKVLVRLEATVRRVPEGANATILPLRILVFTPRGNVKVVAQYLASGNVNLEHPSIPYNPANHRDNPPYENPHQAQPGQIGLNEYGRYAQPNRWQGQSVVAGKSVEVQRSQVDELFKALRSGEDLPDTEPGEYTSSWLLLPQISW